MALGPISRFGKAINREIRSLLDPQEQYEGPDDMYQISDEGKPELKPELFARKYQSRVQSKLAEKGVKWRPGFGFRKLSPDHPLCQSQISTAVTQAAIAASHHLGPSVALSVAGQIARESRPECPDKRKELDETFIKLEPEDIKGVFYEGEVPVYLTDDLSETYEIGSGAALGDSVYLDIDQDYETNPGSTLGDFILGHELSHVKNGDSYSGSGERIVLDSVGEFAQTDPSVSQLHQTLNYAEGEGSRQAEARSDRDGFHFALQRGHKPQDIVEAAKLEYSEEPFDDSWHSHPSSEKRIAHLQALAEEAASQED